MQADGGISTEELQLAARNHGMPLEALRHPVTPIGLHYLLVHYDVPVVDPATWRLEVGGHVAHPRSLTLDDLWALEAVTAPVTLECAGNGRAALTPRPVSQPWLLEAVGTGEWTGPRLADVLAAAGVAAGAVEVLFTGIDRGVEGGVEQSYERSLPLDEALRDDVLLAYALNGVPLPAQHGFRLRAHEDDPGTPVTRIEPRSLMLPPGIPDFMSRRRFAAPGGVMLEGRAWS